MKTYILKFTVFNDIDFPAGTIVARSEQKGSYPPTFIVTEGNLIGAEGRISDGINGWVIDDTPKNRAIVNNLKKEKEHLDFLNRELDKRWRDYTSRKNNFRR